MMYICGNVFEIFCFLVFIPLAILKIQENKIPLVLMLSVLRNSKMNGMMFVGAVWITLVFYGTIFPTSNASSDLERCVSKQSNDIAEIKFVHCLVTKNDVQLYCPPGQQVVLSELQFGVKSTNSFCMKRVLKRNDVFCCAAAANDVLYDGHCLQELWNKEDVIHYRQFISRSLAACSNSSQCVIRSKLFANLQREIPISKMFSTYFQAVYQCTKAPSSSIDLCSSRGVTGKEIDFRHLQRMNTNKTCMCGIRSTDNDHVIVKAVDIRLLHQSLIIRSDKTTNTISPDHPPLFGFREIFSGQRINISLTPGPDKSNDQLWLRVSGSNGKNVQVTCGESVPHLEISPTLHTGRSLTPNIVTRKTVYWGYWPLIYIGVGSLLTIILMVCVLGSYLLCRSSKHKRRRHPCGHPSPADFHQDFYNPPYATVLDDAPHGQQPRVALYMSDQTLRRGYDKPFRTADTGTSTLRYMRSPSEPQSAAERKGSEDQSMSQTRPKVSPGTDSNVSQLEAFLKC